MPNEDAREREREHFQKCKVQFMADPAVPNRKPEVTRRAWKTTVRHKALKLTPLTGYQVGGGAAATPADIQLY
ncbi:hypothetical protein DERF_004277 [Dermatophagoides farinae]|uniref:Uncharacterized protein n=1 Tax=Dermatophagoides farinae TaxID=6954 RepID=A0A922I229_DERFA|nr:hypothetical protein DERF_004277 [Dermatophagoides farinae]